MAKHTSSSFTLNESSQSPPWSKKMRLTDDSVTKDLIRWKIENLFISSGSDVIEGLVSLFERELTAELEQRDKEIFFFQDRITELEDENLRIRRENVKLKRIYQKER